MNIVADDIVFLTEEITTLTRAKLTPFKSNPLTIPQNHSFMKAINIPAIRSVLGGIVYYTASFTFKQIAESVKMINDELYSSASLKRQLQQSLTKNYESITNYILSQKEHFFNALVLAVYDGEPIWNEIEIGFKGEDYYNMGFLMLNGNEKIFPVDGQHRVEGIKDAIKENPELEDETISVILIGHQKNKEGMERTRRIFSTLNRYAKPVSIGDIIALDEDDTVAIVTRELLESYPLFMNDNVKDSKRSKVLLDETKAFTSLITLYETNRIIYKYYKSFKDDCKRLYSGTKIADFLKFRPEQTEIDAFEAYLKDFWNRFCDAFDGMTEYVNSTNRDAALKFRNKDDGGLLYFRPVALPQLVIAILETCFRSKISVQESMKAFARLELCISKAPWVNVLWEANKHTMIVSNATLVHSLLMYMNDKSILTEKEVNDLRKRYAGIHEVGLEEADKMLKGIMA